MQRLKLILTEVETKLVIPFEKSATGASVNLQAAIYATALRKSADGTGQADTKAARIEQIATRDGMRGVGHKPKEKE